MFLTILAAILIGIALVALLTSLKDMRIDGRNFKTPVLLAGSICMVLGVTIMFTKSYKQVEEGEVSVPVKFGKAGNPAEAGVHFAAPWTDWHDLPAREQVLSFEGDSVEREERGLDDITMQTKGGGGFDMDARVRYSINPAEAADVWRKLGTDYESKVVIPASRECFRDASVTLDLTEAITSARPQIAASSKDCLQNKLEKPYGLRVLSVELGGTQVPESVQEQINAKQGAEQKRQEALTNLEKSKVDAERKKIEAQATAESAQIVACGATTDRDGNLVAKEDCTNRFTQEYLDWLYIQNLQNVDKVIVVDPRLGENSQVLIGE